MSLDLTRVHALCFDVDGTLRDTDDQYVDRLAGYLRAIRVLLPQREPKFIARRVIMAIEDPGSVMLSLVDRLGIDDLNARLLRALDRPRMRKNTRPPIIPGVSEMLETLRLHYPLAVISTRSQRVAQEFLDDYELAGFFQVIVTGQTCQRTKPHPMPVLWAAEQMGVSPGACLMVGDTPVDIRAGRAAGAQTVGVLCGFGTEKELLKSGADLILNSTPELVYYLLPNERRA